MELFILFYFVTNLSFHNPSLAWIHEITGCQVDILLGLAPKRMCNSLFTVDCISHTVVKSSSRLIPTRELL